MTKEQRLELVKKEFRAVTDIQNCVDLESWPTTRKAFLEYVRNVDEIIEIYNVENRVVS